MGRRSRRKKKGKQRGKGVTGLMATSAAATTRTCRGGGGVTLDLGGRIYTGTNVAFEKLQSRDSDGTSIVSEAEFVSARNHQKPKATGKLGSSCRTYISMYNHSRGQLYKNAAELTRGFFVLRRFVAVGVFIVVFCLSAIVVFAFWRFV